MFNHNLIYRVALCALGVALLPHCSSDDDTTAGAGGSTATGGSGGSASGNDITDAVFERTSAACADYAGTYTSAVRDVGTATSFAGLLTIAVGGSDCTFSSNSIPNHDFNDGPTAFVNVAAEVNESFNVPGNPMAAATSTPLTLEYDNAIMLNGAKLDLLAAACYGVGNEPLGQEKIGCNDSASPWRYDPMFAGNNFGTDTHNAHTQPDGAYHYHGSPLAMFDTTGAAPSPVIGFAADGFPIFGSYIDDGGVRKVVSGYTLKAGARISMAGEGALPPGNYDGAFRDDYEFTDAGDLDECNGMMQNGSYGYYVTDAFPWVLGCFTATPDASFRKSGPP
jgi:hypothetical protein